MDSSHLSRLSPELRNLIYAHVFTSPYAVTLQSGSIEHALTKTCRQMRHETLAMYYNLTRFNAHLDDGPATPLANWLRVLGKDLVMQLEEVNVWDLHNLNGTMHGRDSSLRLLAQKEPTYHLREISPAFLNRGFLFTEIVTTLRSMGLNLARFCVRDDFGMIKLTSEFAMVESGASSIRNTDVAQNDDSSDVTESRG